MTIVFPTILPWNKNYFSWVCVELAWAFNFFVTIGRVDPEEKILTWRQSSLAYLRTWLVPDALCLTVSLIALVLRIQDLHLWCQLLRCCHFVELFYPVELIVVRFSNVGKKRVRQIINFVMIFAACFILGHICACFWILIGRIEND